ncbi:MAG: tRNA pseudouridine(55) synthase TruB [Candidatus Jorgensenbacteria bacterium]
MDKIFAVWKPKGPTSHDIVNEVRRATGERRVGHAGTLDPLAEGILVIGVGREATKKLQTVVEKEKEYFAEIKLGEESSTDDEAGDKKAFKFSFPPSQGMVKSTLENFLGEIEQVPPQFSAVKVRGKPAHRRVRGGETVELKSRRVKIREIRFLKYDWPYLTIRVVTGPGVYIRALARDIGRELKTGGYLKGLVRTRVGEYRKENAVEISKLKPIIEN